MNYKRLLNSLIMLLCAVQLMAQKLTIDAPSQAQVGDRIRVSYTLNSNDFDRIQVDGDFDGFEVLFGPSISTSSSISIINGKTSQSASTTFTYTLGARKAGTFTIPSASLVCGGRKLKSGTQRIQIVPSSGGGSQQSQSGYGSQSSAYSGGSQGSGGFHTPSSGERIGPRDLYFTVTASKNHVYEQEAILLTYKLYSLVTVDQVAGEIPQLDGFHTQEIELPQQRSFSRENVNGRSYGSVVWRQYVVFPQKSGKLVIPAIDYQVDVVTQDRSIDPFDAFFGGGSMTQRVTKTVKAPSVEITVDSLPAKPANFSGAVGHGFTISGKLSPQSVDANDATTLSLTVSGTGNVKLISAPVVKWPKDFEQYDLKTQQDTKLTTAGTTGKVTYDYVAVPHHEGKYTIPAVEFCYFDTESKSYKTITTASFNLDVAKGSGHHSSEQEELEELDNDIHFIKKGSVEMTQPDESFFGSISHWMSYLILIVVFIILMVIFRRQAVRNADYIQLRGKKAGKAAAKRLKNASTLMAAGKEEAFYDEVMRALWGYVADKLNLPVTDLTKDNVSEKLQARNVNEDVTARFLNVLEECEFARFAPGDPASNMDHLFNDATEIINQLDETL